MRIVRIIWGIFCLLKLAFAVYYQNPELTFMIIYFDYATILKAFLRPPTF